MLLKPSETLGATFSGLINSSQEALKAPYDQLGNRFEIKQATQLFGTIGAVAASVAILIMGASSLPVIAGAAAAGAVVGGIGTTSAISAIPGIAAGMVGVVGTQRGLLYSPLIIAGSVLRWVVPTVITSTRVLFMSPFKATQKLFKNNATSKKPSQSTQAGDPSATTKLADKSVVEDFNPQAQKPEAKSDTPPPPKNDQTATPPSP